MSSQYPKLKRHADAGVGRGATRAFGRNAQIAVIRQLIGERESDPKLTSPTIPTRSGALSGVHERAVGRPFVHFERSEIRLRRLRRLSDVSNRRQAVMRPAIPRAPHATAGVKFAFRAFARMQLPAPPGCGQSPDGSVGRATTRPATDCPGAPSASGRPAHHWR